MTGVYLPGRERRRWVDLAGMVLIFGTLGGTLSHGLMRGLSRYKNRRQEPTGGNHS